MQDFIQSISNGRIRERLEDAINGRKPFRSFKIRLGDYPDIRLQWFDFQHQCMRKRAVVWLEFQGIQWVEE